jgi:acyl-[acyl-carrier-protein]-phospholipid O-acyltransferase/long-chain-fatty-acid--[acyl-carrier-protein] ligase
MLLHYTFIDTAKRRGGHLAIKDTFRNTELSYNRLLIACLMFSHRIKKMEDGYIGIMLPTSAGAIISVIACLFAGKVPVMINYSTGAETNIRFAQGKCHFKTVITARTVLDKVGCPEMEEMVFADDILASLSKWEKLRAAALASLPAPVLRRIVSGGRDSDTSVILFTSGSEKEPKAVELTHRNILSNFEAICKRVDFTVDDSIMAILPFFHVLGFNTNIWLPMLKGMAVYTYPNPLEFKTVALLIEKEKPTALIGTPYFLMNYLKQSSESGLSSLRFVVVGADKAPEWLHEAFMEQYGLELLEGYGATETSPVISVNAPGANKPGSVGRPLEGVEVRIVDVATGKDLDTGEEGKILVRGDLVMKGYFDDLEETALKVEDSWYETGDMGVLDEDGFLWHHGRLKRFVKVAGEMISLVQVEEALSHHLPEDVEVCVVELPDAKKGATIVAAITNAVDEHKLKSQLKRSLPPLAIPRQFLVIDELPKMGSGKIDFRTTTLLVHELLS